MLLILMMQTSEWEKFCQGEFTDECMRVLRIRRARIWREDHLSSTWRETAPQRRAVDARLVAHGLLP